ncbi:uncharacterized protein LOC121869350 [Homarus americanus]|uniref:uncharacterized protein LOC121869350 n=1 Tax=Homarus americanus TaxID=6706 RepID=UPI001C46BECD|nr:uncharacterized protein LOC121869350 [Homarus americanus]
MKFGVVIVLAAFCLLVEAGLATTARPTHRRPYYRRTSIGRQRAAHPRARVTVAPAQTTLSPQLKPGHKIITELPKPEPGFYLNQQFQSEKVARTSNTPGEVSPRVFESNLGSLKLYEFPKPRPGYYLNKQFQNINTLKEKVKKSPRKVVDSNGKYWTVGELPKPKAEYYLNRQFQTKRVFPLKDSSYNADSNVETLEIFLVKKHTEGPTIRVPATSPPVLTQSPVVTFRQATRGKPTGEVNFYTVFGQENSRNVNIRQQQPSVQPRHRPQQVAQRVTASSSIRSSFGSPSTQAIEMPEVRTGFGPPSTITQPQQESTARPDTSTNKRTFILTAQQPTRQGQPRREQEQTVQTEQLQPGFSCQGQEYGYYADVESDCQGYHICNPVNFGGGLIQYYKYSFECSPGMKWVQHQQACISSTDAPPCQ